MSKLIVTPLAECDIEAIGDYIAQENPRRAVSFIKELFSQCKTIARNPLGYRLRPELAGGPARAPMVHVIFFSAAEQEVTIIRVLHGTRDIPGEFIADQ